DAVGVIVAAFDDYELAEGAVLGEVVDVGRVPAFVGPAVVLVVVDGEAGGDLVQPGGRAGRLAVVDAEQGAALEAEADGAVAGDVGFAELAFADAAFQLEPPVGVGEGFKQRGAPYVNVFHDGRDAAHAFIMARSCYSPVL